MTSFRNYVQEFFELAQQGTKPFIAKLERDDSLLGLHVFKNNQEEYILKNGNRGNHCRIFYRLASESIEGVHANCTFVDEMKMVAKNIFLTSLLPCSGGRLGRNILISSASDKPSYFQQLVEQNYRMEIEDVKNNQLKAQISGEFNKPGFSFVGNRLFIQNWRQMSRDNHKYSQTVSRAINAVDGDMNDKSFLTQYENVFSDTGSTQFYNIKDLNGSFFDETNYRKYVNNSNYVIVAGWDVAVNGEDSSILCIKAFENKFGIDRKSFTIANICLNPRRCKQTENLKAQVVSVMSWIKHFEIRAIAIDTTGIGNSADVYLQEEVSDAMYYMDYHNIIPIVISTNTRFDMLEFYYNRISSGMEFFRRPNTDTGIQDMRLEYGRRWHLYDEDAMWVKFHYEHSVFQRTEYFNTSTGRNITTYLQLAERNLHDDTVFASALCSYALKQNPAILNYNAISKGNSKGGFYAFNKNKRWG